MSQRETFVKPVTLLQVGGVNQRVKSTELPLHEYVTLNGVFPEFAGLQSRIWGKRVLKLYPNSLYGIHQFWTPMGYGGGIYQFTGTVDFGQWLTPNSSFDLTIPPLEIDGGGMTLDEFGNGYGSNFGYGTTNACLISFLDGSSDHSACLAEIEALDTPDDANGSPAGQGKTCKWVDEYVDIDVETWILIKEQGIGGYNQSEVTENVGRVEHGCAVTPPYPPMIGPNIFFSFYEPVATTGAIGSQQKLEAQWLFAPVHSNPFCDGRVAIIQRTSSPNFNHKVTFNFGALRSLGAWRVTMLASDPSSDHEIIIADTAEIESGVDIHVDMEKYRAVGEETHPTAMSTARMDWVSVSQLRIYVRNRVCS